MPAGQRTADPYHGPQPLRLALDERHHDGRAEVAQARGNGADDTNVAIAGKLWNGRVVLLEYTIRQREACAWVSREATSSVAGVVEEAAYPKDKLQT